MRRMLIAAAALAAVAGTARAESDHYYQEPSSSHDFGYRGEAPRGGGWRRGEVYAYGYDRYGYDRRSYDDRQYDRRGYRYDDRGYPGGLVEADPLGWLRRLDRRLRDLQDRWRP